MTIPSIDITVGNLHQNSSKVPLAHEDAIRELAKDTFTLNGITSLPRITVDKMIFSATYTLQISTAFSAIQDKCSILKHLAEKVFRPVSGYAVPELRRRGTLPLPSGRAANRRRRNGTSPNDCRPHGRRRRRGRHA